MLAPEHTNGKMVGTLLLPGQHQVYALVWDASSGGADSGWHLAALAGSGLEGAGDHETSRLTASFSDLRASAVAIDGSVLYVIDGQALREVSLHAPSVIGYVRTLSGTNAFKYAAFPPIDGTVARFLNPVAVWRAPMGVGGGVLVLEESADAAPTGHRVDRWVRHARPVQGLASRGARWEVDTVVNATTFQLSLQAWRHGQPPMQLDALDQWQSSRLWPLGGVDVSPAGIVAVVTGGSRPALALLSLPWGQERTFRVEAALFPGGLGLGVGEERAQVAFASGVAGNGVLVALPERRIVAIRPRHCEQCPEGLTSAGGPDQPPGDTACICAAGRYEAAAASGNSGAPDCRCVPPRICCLLPPSSPPCPLRCRHRNHVRSECRPCPRPFFCPGGSGSASSPRSCPGALEGTPAEGMRSAADCRCLPGSARGDDGVCRECGEDLICPGGSMEREQRRCAPHSSTQGVRGAYSPSQCVCQAGYEAVPSRVDATSTSCRLAPRGRYVPFAGASARACPASQTTLVLGATSHEQCQCAPGTYVSGGRCQVCTVGYVCPGDGTRQRCDFGLGSLPGSTTTSDCTCPDGSAAAAAAGCSACRAKQPFFCRSGHVFRCPPMSWASRDYPRGVLDCTCVPGYRWEDPGDLWRGCVPCSPGFFCPGGGSALPCPEPSMSPPGSSHEGQCLCELAQGYVAAPSPVAGNAVCTCAEHFVNGPGYPAPPPQQHNPCR